MGVDESQQSQSQDALGVKGDELEDGTVEHLNQLTPEEKVIEKKLQRKIDLLVLPAVIAVYSFRRPFILAS